MNFFDFLNSMRNKVYNRFKSEPVTIVNPMNEIWKQEAIAEEEAQKARELEKSRYKSLGDYEVSMYNPRVDQTDADPWIAPRNFNLKTGTEAGGHYLAVARKGQYDPTPMIPYGTKVRLGGVEYEVRDLMGAFANDKPQWGMKRVDIFHPDESEAGAVYARKFGRQRIPMDLILDNQQ